MVHVWRSYFQPGLLSDMQFSETLSSEEIDKARRFVRPLDRERYIFAHVQFRSILSAYVGCMPRQLIFKTNQYGKPFLVSPGGSNDILFNLSHSEDMTLFVVTRGNRVGIDVECMRKVPDAIQIVNSVFSVSERKFLNSLPPADFAEGFFAIWTSKEAFLKGIGMGLSYPLDKFSITFSKGEPDNLIHVHDDPANSDCWTIRRLSPGPGYTGALATEEVRSEPKFFQYYLP